MAEDEDSLPCTGLEMRDVLFSALPTAPMLRGWRCVVQGPGIGLLQLPPHRTPVILSLGMDD